MDYKAFNYAGNKDREMKQFYELVKDNIEDKKYIIEPYGGSFSLIRHIFNEFKNKFKYVVNDNDKRIINIYKELQNDKNNDILQDKIKHLEETITSPDLMKPLVKCNKNESYLFGHLKYCIRPYLYPTTKKVNINYKRLTNFKELDKVKFTDEDFLECVEKYEDKKNAFIFLDPPYFMSNNDEYLNKCVDTYFKYILKLKDKKATFLIVVNSHILTNIFMENVGLHRIKEYDVTYLGSRKRTKHIIFSNKQLIN
jgi:site-specific DNA-adenine methylase